MQKKKSARGGPHSSAGMLRCIFLCLYTKVAKVPSWMQECPTIFAPLLYAHAWNVTYAWTNETRTYQGEKSAMLQERERLDEEISMLESSKAAIQDEHEALLQNISDMEQERTALQEHSLRLTRQHTTLEAQVCTRTWMCFSVCVCVCVYIYIYIYMNMWVKLLWYVWSCIYVCAIVCNWQGSTALCPGGKDIFAYICKYVCMYMRVLVAAEAARHHGLSSTMRCKEAHLRWVYIYPSHLQETVVCKIEPTELVHTFLQYTIHTRVLTIYIHVRAVETTTRDCYEPKRLWKTTERVSFLSDCAFAYMFVRTCVIHTNTFNYCYARARLIPYPLMYAHTCMDTYIDVYMYTHAWVHA